MSGVRSFKNHFNEKLTPSIQAVNNFSGAKHNILAVLENTTDSSKIVELNETVDSNRQYLSSIMVCAEGDSFSSQNVTVSFYKRIEVGETIKDFELSSFNVVLPATSANSYETVDLQSNDGIIDFLDVTGITGNITIAAQSKVYLIGIFFDRNDIATSSIQNNTESSSIKTELITDSDVDIDVVENGKIYSCGVVDSLDITAPSTFGLDFTAQLNFSSGSTATTLTSSGITFSGDDVTDGTLTPAAEKRYSIMFYSDGVNFVGSVKGI